MSIRLWRLIAQTRHVVVLVALMWMLAVSVWLAARAHQIGGRPLSILWGEDPRIYDPQATSHPVAASVFRHVCEPLYYEDFDGNIRGLLAEDSFAYADEGKQITVHLRQDITFHNGATLNAQAVQASFERLRRLGVSPLATALYNVTVAAQPDGRTVLFTLPAPDYEFVRLVLANPYAAIVSPNIDDDSNFIDCTGPYRFAAELYDLDRSLTIVRNLQYAWPPHYFANRNAAYIPQIHFIYEGERTARLDRLLHGNGCVLSLSQEHLSQVASESRLRLYHAMGGLTYLGFNFLKPLWQDERARQAVAMALDKNMLAASGPFTVTNTPLTPAAAGYDARAATHSYSYNLERSRALLRDAQFDTRAEVVLLIPEDKTYRDLASIVQKQLAAIGLGQVRLHEAPRIDILNQRQNFDLLLFDYAWSDYSALGIFLGAGPRNLLHYPNEDVAKIIQKARTIADPDARNELVLSAQRVVLAQAIWQPLLIRQITFAVNKGCVHGERQSPFGEILFHDADTRFPHY